MRKVIIALFLASMLYSCIKPYACECTYTATKQKHHVLIYASRYNRDEACKKQAIDTTETCVLKN
ncbi:MAG: hypothetical protein ACXVPQ_01955 [Bacteroidia bacterium]